MKTIIFAGGLGTRLSEETDLKPKPMIYIGDKPIIWHILKIYSYHGVNDFLICCGYKGHVIKEYFKNYFLHNSDISFDMMDHNSFHVHNNHSEPWKITLVDTGEKTNTGGRLKRVKKYIKNEDTFCLTYGDGLGNIDISSLIKFHKKHGKKATLTATRPPARYGSLKLGHNYLVDNFQEKPIGDGSWINGGFFVLNPSVIDLIKNDSSSWESDVLVELAKKKQLCAYKHNGFWQPMDTMREKILLNEMWAKNKAPWKIWK